MFLFLHFKNETELYRASHKYCREKTFKASFRTVKITAGLVALYASLKKLISVL